MATTRARARPVPRSQRAAHGSWSARSRRCAPAKPPRCDRGNGFALELLRGGASRLAYLLDERLPSIDTVLGALREVRAGQTVLDPSIVDSLVRRHDSVVIDDLTMREVDVLEQIAHGLSNGAVAAELHISVKAVEKYVTVIFRKLGLADQSLVDRRVAAVLAYLRAQTSPLTLHHRTADTEPEQRSTPPAPTDGSRSATVSAAPAPNRRPP